MEDAADGSNSKRRRTTSPSPTPSTHLLDIPENLLVEISSYLPKLTRTLFVVAASAPSSSWYCQYQNGKPRPQLSNVSYAIRATLNVGRWIDSPVLDFANIEKQVAKSLTDDDIFSILVCIEANEYLDTLILTNCVNITGRGLGPLFDSSRINRIDLSILGQSDGDQVDEPNISEAAVLPILHSIVDARYSILGHLLLPKKWRDVRSTSLKRFLVKYDESLKAPLHCCHGCHKVIRGNFISYEDDPSLPSWYCGRTWGLQKYTCSICTKHFCRRCSEDRRELKFCNICEGNICLDCAEVNDCSHEVRWTGKNCRM